MKIIFLDVDGVLNAFTRNDANQLELTGGEAINEQKAALLSEIVKQTGARIVLHSGWRFWFDEAMKPMHPSAEKLVRVLEKFGLILLDKTPDMSTDEIRKTKRFSLVKAQEIRAWLLAHPQVADYVLLEDLDLGDTALMRRQVRTESTKGLTEIDAAAAIAILNH